ncbi:MAG TPA: bifunctional DNA-formamidopyrimidine glycosylase/DNA-(apurinic or apyrimidinic site) lyase [Candidatus Melainabacteria bacterium]|nr:bifunctional DNA-formamidopyrimidine glycosylase/DNA-(apurinic or apyrimidinic site) lyase [Candidatus Melainabacteria bacterium]HIN66387.1 bifunctional DNA-formamidopyrimidine glycosylase/DNA-(apurinic or apyrimidinic site) lyase [Candidatus Obscuribacterales bacterium]
MPELPEVETVRLGLERFLVGDSFAGVQVLRNDSVGYPAVKDFVKGLTGRTVVAAKRRGKYLLLELDSNAGLGVHLRMSGRLIVADEKHREAQFLRVLIKLKSGRELRFEDMRVFGRMWYVPPGEDFLKVIPALQELGPEPLEGLTAEHLVSAFRGKKQAIKTALLDQTIIAGLGNIYADEVLFQTGIHPLSLAGSITEGDAEKLVVAIAKTLKKAIKHGGTTLRDYANSEGVNGNYQHQSWVYGREDEPCRVCGTEIERIKLAGRSAHFCGNCQKKLRRKR